MNIRKLFVLIILLFFSVVLLAAEKEQRENATAAEEKVKKPKLSIGKRSSVKTLEEFIPSEEVSADKPVAFPSDI
jgi:hypothetical protein